MHKSLHLGGLKRKEKGRLFHGKFSPLFLPWGKEGTVENAEAISSVSCLFIGVKN